MPESNRDRSVERVLRHVLSERASDPGLHACVDGETLAAWAEGQLGPDEAGRIERHVADCAHCQSMMAAFVRMRPAAPQAEPAPWHWWRLRWLVPLATAATVAGLLFAVPGRMPVDSSQHDEADVAVETAPPRADTPPAAAPSAATASPLAEPVPSSPEASSERRRLAREDAGGRAEAFDVRQESARQDRAATPPPPAGAELQKAEPAAPQRRMRSAASPQPQVEIVAEDGTSRWRITNGQQVERSTSGDRAWQPATIDGSDPLTAGAAPSSSVCWIVGQRGAVFLTTDGQTFVRVLFPQAVDLVAVTASDDRNATVTTKDGLSWQTTDQGLSWTPVR